MGKAELKTNATEVSVAEFIAAVPDARRREEAAVIALCREDSWEMKRAPSMRTNASGWPPSSRSRLRAMAPYAPAV